MSAYIDPQKELAALAAVMASLADLGEGDEGLRLDMAEGQTRIFDVIDALLEQEADAAAFVDAMKERERVIADRRARLERRREAARALIEQTMLILDVTKLERPCATLSLQTRPRKVHIKEGEEHLIPARFWVTADPKIDKKVLNEAVLGGEAVPGAFADNGSVSLTLRSK